MSEKTRRMIANCLLLIAGAIWGGGFVVMKNALDNISTNYLLAIRFAIGAVGLSYTLFSKKNPLTRYALLGGAVTGGCLYGAFAVQTYGLLYTTAGKNALITAIYVVLVPFILWIQRKERPDTRVMVAAVMMLTGIALLSLNGREGMNIGDFLTLLCGIGYALHIVYVDKFEQRVDVMQLTCLQFAFASAYAWIAALLFEQPPASFGAETIGALAYCGIAGTLIALTLQNVGIKYASPEYASLFMSTEAAFGCIFGVIFLNEAMTGRMTLGCVLILCALVLSQVDWKAVMAKRKGANNEA